MTSEVGRDADGDGDASNSSDGLVNRSLFDDDEVPTLAARLALRLHALAERGVYFGTSSWKYEGWLGSIYTRERYVSRRKFSRKKFEAECLREYAATFPVVGGDFSFYRFPSPDLYLREQPPGRQRPRDHRGRRLRRLVKSP
jgi:hypothetical protein